MICPGGGGGEGEEGENQFYTTDELRSRIEKSTFGSELFPKNQL